MKLSAASEIDSLKTFKDIENFLVEKVNKDLKKYTIFKDIKRDTSKYCKNSFVKIDLDNNGLNDLVVNGNYFFAVIDEGNKSYSLHLIDRSGYSADKYTLSNIIYIDQTPLLLVKNYYEFKTMQNTNLKDDTLIYKYGGFIEYNSSPDTLMIEKIRLTTFSFNTAYLIEITVKKNRKVKIKSLENPGILNYCHSIDKSVYSNLIAIINYLKLASIKDHYKYFMPGAKTIRLEIKYNKGTIKKIEDYGGHGTFGLELLYKQLFAIDKKIEATANKKI